MSNNFKNWINERKEHNSDPDVLEILEEMDADVSIESIEKGNLLTFGLCMKSGEL